MEVVFSCSSMATLLFLSLSDFVAAAAAFDDDAFVVVFPLDWTRNCLLPTMLLMFPFDWLVGSFATRAAVRVSAIDC